MMVIYMSKINTLLQDSSATVALIVAVALLLWATGLPLLINTARAATLTAVSDTISDSDLGVVANHTISFTTSSGVAANGTIIVTFPAGFTIGNKCRFWSEPNHQPRLCCLLWHCYYGYVW